MAFGTQDVIHIPSITANSSGDEDGKRWPGGLLQMFGAGTWGGATVTAEWSFAQDGNGVWTPLPKIVLSANGIPVNDQGDPIPLYLAAGRYVRLQVTGGGVLDLTLSLSRVAKAGKV